MSDDKPKPPILYVGDRVIKDSGDYTFEGDIQAVFRKRSGAIRYVVEDDRGLCFIQSPGQQRKVN